MKKLVALTMIFLLLTGPLVTVLAEEESNSGGQVITGDNYEITVPEDLRVIDTERWAELGQKTFSALDIYLEENPEEAATVEAEIAELKEIAAASSELIEEKTGVDIQGVKDASVEQGKKNAELFKKFQFEARSAMKFEIVGLEYEVVLSLSSDLSQVEDVTSKYSAEEIKELNYIDFSKDEKASFKDKTENAIAAYYSIPGYAETEVVSGEEVVLPSNDDVEVVRTTYATTPVFEKGTSRTIVSYSTVVSGNLFVMQYCEKGDAGTVEAAAGEIFNTLAFTEVDRKDILGMEPDVFRKVAFIAVVTGVILIIVLLVLKNNKKKKAAMQEQQRHFEGVQYGAQNVSQGQNSFGPNPNAFQEQNSFGTNQNVSQEQNSFGTNHNVSQEQNSFGTNQNVSQEQNTFGMNQNVSQGQNTFGTNQNVSQGQNSFGTNQNASQEQNSFGTNQDQETNGYQNQNKSYQQSETVGQNVFTEETQPTLEASVEETGDTPKSEEDEV